jgi:hypothetical protein
MDLVVINISEQSVASIFYAGDGASMLQNYSIVIHMTTVLFINTLKVWNPIWNKYLSQTCAL